MSGVTQTRISQQYLSLIPANQLVYTLVLLPFSPLENELNQVAENHLDFLDFVFDLYGKRLHNVMALTSDNYSINKTIACRSETVLIGSASHRCNLYVKDVINDSVSLIEKVNCLMRKMCYLIPAVQLRKHTYLKAKCKNLTKWSSTARIFKRSFEIDCFS